MTALLDVRSASVRYGAIAALRNVDLVVGEGEIVALLGPNGAGKTSLVSAIAGIVPLATGDVHFDGANISNLAVEDIVRRGISVTPEGRRVFADLTVTENLQLGAAIRADRQGVADDIERNFSMFPILKARARSEAKTLSGGEQQMLAIARSLMSKPRLLVLDEPSLGLAPKIVDQIFELMAKLRDEGLTMLVVEQNAAEALSFADRAYVLNSGECVYSGTAAEVANSDDLIAHYLGDGIATTALTD